jgi:hypothetical protein
MDRSPARRPAVPVAVAIVAVLIALLLAPQQRDASTSGVAAAFPVAQAGFARHLSAGA